MVFCGAFIVDIFEDCYKQAYYNKYELEKQAISHEIPFSHAVSQKTAVKNGRGTVLRPFFDSSVIL